MSHSMTDPSGTTCEHGIPWAYTCERCEKDGEAAKVPAIYLPPMPPRKWSVLGLPAQQVREYAIAAVEQDRRQRALDRMVAESERLGLYDTPKHDQQPVAWLYEDTLPHEYPYDLMYPYSKVDGVRMFPVFAPPSDARKAMQMALRSLDELTRHASSNGPDMKPHRSAADALRAALGEAR